MEGVSNTTGIFCVKQMQSKPTTGRWVVWKFFCSHQSSIRTLKVVNCNRLAWNVRKEKNHDMQILKAGRAPGFWNQYDEKLCYKTAIPAHLATYWYLKTYFSGFRTAFPFKIIYLVYKYSLMFLCGWFVYKKPCESLKNFCIKINALSLDRELLAKWLPALWFRRVSVNKV